MLRLMVFVMVPPLARGLALSRGLAMEYLAMKHDLASRRTGKRIQVSRRFKAFWMLFRAVWPSWRRVCATVQPETVIRWHRAGFRLFWSLKSRRPKGPRTQKRLVALIRKMAMENPDWGAPRVHGELLKLGFKVSERTVSRFMPKRILRHKDRLRRRQTWKTFLENHREVIAAMDFLVVPAWDFKPLYVLVILDHGRRIVRHINATAHPTAEWVKAQLREAFPFDEIPKYLLFDRDTTFAAVRPFVEAMGIRPKLTAYHCPWQNGFVERMHGTLRRDLLDHVIPRDEVHLRRLLKDYLRYYREDRTHLGLGKDAPRGRPLEKKPDERSKVQALPRCGGLHQGPISANGVRGSRLPAEPAIEGSYVWQRAA